MNAHMTRLMAEATAEYTGPSVVDALEFRRDQYGLTKADFALLIGMHKSHYSEFVAGKRSLPKNAMCRAARIGVPMSILLQVNT